MTGFLSLNPKGLGMRRVIDGTDSTYAIGKCQCQNDHVSCSPSFFLIDEAWLLHPNDILLISLFCNKSLLQKRLHFYIMGEKKKSLVFVKDPEHAWVPATLISQEGDKAKVSVPTYKDEQSMICDGGRSAKESEERVVKLKDYPNKVLPLQNVDGNNNMPEFADMVQLPYLHEVRKSTLLISQRMGHRTGHKRDTVQILTIFFFVSSPRLFGKPFNASIGCHLVQLEKASLPWKAIHPYGRYHHRCQPFPMVHRPIHRREACLLLQ